MTHVMDRVAASGNGIILLLGRLAMAAIFVPSGFSKLTHLGTFAASLANHGLPAPYLLAIVGAATEFFGSICVALGYGVRYVALLMAIFTTVAALLSHHFWDMQGAAHATQYVQFMKNMAIVGGFLILFAAGPGPYSVDRTSR